MPWNFDPNKRLWSRVKTSAPDKCWEWQGARIPAGYGLLTIRYKNILAHRLAWELTNGPIPNRMHICHTCDNPACCNPKHLFLGSASDNIQDAANKGRMRHGEYHPSAKLTSDKVRAIRKLAEEGINHCEISRRINISRQSVNDVLYRRTWKHVD